MDDVFLPVQTGDYYWSSTTYSGASVAAMWLLYFQGSTSYADKQLPLYVRAVRTR